jgi:hypothetical protein
MFVEGLGSLLLPLEEILQAPSQSLPVMDDDVSSDIICIDDVHDWEKTP